MAYGLRVYDASGDITLDTTDRITRLRWYKEVAAGASGDTTLSDIDGLETVEISTKISTDHCTAAHLVSRSGTTISWDAQSGTNYNSADSLIFVFLYT